MANDSYKTFLTSVRPAKVACFININNENWQEGAMTIIKAFSRVWGGAFFIIVPTDGQTISSAFWHILLAYDPDYLWVYNPRPAGPYGPSFELSANLQQDLKLRLAPLYFQNHIIQGGAYPNFVPKFPYTDLITILPNCEHPSSLVEVSDSQGVMQLWTASVTGSASSGYKEALISINIDNRTVEYGNRLPELFDLASRGIRGSLTDDKAGFPFAFSLTQLGFYRSLDFPDWKEATLVIVGETLQDFCLYYCLSRMRKHVLWLLPSWFPSAGADDHSMWSDDTYLGNFARSLDQLVIESRLESNIYILSVSLKPDEISEARNLLNQSWYNLPIEERLPIGEQQPNDQTPDANLTSAMKFLLQHPFRLYETGNAGRDTFHHFDGEDMTGRFETPKPKNFSYIPPYDHRWITEIFVIDHQLPRQPLLGERVVLHPTGSSLTSRVGKDGIAYLCPNSASFGGDLDQTLVKPAIHLPSCISLFQQLMKGIGYDCQISDKGRFTLDTLLKFRSISSLAYFLTTEHKRAVLEKYLDNKSPGPDVKDEGIFLQSDRRRYLDFASVRKITESDKSAADLIDDLIVRSAFHRGLILKCEFCRSTDWFSIAELSNEFRCKRCNRVQVYSQSHALSKLEPPWYYKLDEIVFKGLANNMMVPVLALNRLSIGIKSFLFSPDLELLDLKSGKQLFELDICCVINGELTIGEAKKNKYLGKTAREEREVVNKYFDLAQKIGASQVVFATYSEQWRDETLKLINERFTDSLIKLTLMNHADLSKAY
jgi:hypothetical protein